MQQFRIEIIHLKVHLMLLDLSLFVVFHPKITKYSDLPLELATI